jgi:parallel beta-helix repeat protein
MDSNQTLIFEGYTINVANDVSGGGTDPFAYWNGHAVIKNRNGAGTGAASGGEWSGTGLGGETNITVIGGTIDGTNQDPLYVYNAVQLHDITDCKVINVKANNVLQRTSVPTGNFDTRNSTNIKFINCESINTDKTGLWANDTTDLLVQGGYFYLSGDSGIGGETNIRPVIDGVLVDNAGRLPSPDGASNITMDLRGGKVINCTSINASGTVNGYGLTVGHPDPFFAYNTVVSNNHFEGNAVNGIRVQGLSTKGITIEGNTFINNGNAVVDGGAGGININQATSVTVSNNYFQNNRHGVITSNGATNNVISNNVIEDSNQFGINLGSSGNFIKNNTLKGNLVVQIYDGGTDNLHVGNTHSDGAAYVSDIQSTFTVKKTLPLDASLMTDSLLKLQPASPSTNSAVIGSSSGISMQVDGRGGLYGMTASTYVDTARDDFTYKIKAHKGTEAGVELLSLTDDGDLTANNLRQVTKLYQ